MVDPVIAAWIYVGPAAWIYVGPTEVKSIIFEYLSLSMFTDGVTCKIIKYPSFS